MQTMRIIQLTDLHINREGEESRGVDVRSNFCDILKGLPKWRPDEIVITGDLCMTDGNQQDKVLANAPDAREGFFAVPKVVE